MAHEVLLPGVTVRIGQHECTVSVSRYPGSGNLALELYDKADGSHVATPTTNRGYTVEDGAVMIRDAIQNASMVSALQRAGVIGSSQLGIATYVLSVPVPATLVSRAEAKTLSQ